LENIEFHKRGVPWTCVEDFKESNSLQNRLNTPGKKGILGQ